MSLIFFISDVHFPDHNIKAWNLTKKIISDVCPDLIILGGDIFDFQSVSHFLIKPNLSLKLQQDLDNGIKELQSLRNLYKGKILFYPGNHDGLRLQKFLYTHAKQLSNLRSLQLPNILNLKDLDIQYHDREKQPWYKINNLYILHGDENKLSMPNAAKKLFERLHENVIVGHHHKFDSYYHRTFSGLNYQSHVNACLQNRDPDWAGFTQWDLGFSAIEMSSSKFFKIEQMRFIEKIKNISLVPNYITGKISYTS